MTEPSVTFPDGLASEAAQEGLLTPQAIEKLLREAMEQRRQIDGFFATVERLRAPDIPPMSEEEIQAEVDAIRTERRATVRPCGSYLTPARLSPCCCGPACRHTLA